MSEWKEEREIRKGEQEGRMKKGRRIELTFVLSVVSLANVIRMRLVLLVINNNSLLGLLLLLFILVILREDSLARSVCDLSKEVPVDHDGLVDLPKLVPVAEVGEDVLVSFREGWVLQKTMRRSAWRRKRVDGKQTRKEEGGKTRGTWRAKSGLSGRVRG